MNLRFGCLVLAATSLAFGLDPTRTLTQYVHRIWQNQQGLPQGTVYSIVQTHDGYLWLGSQAGLIRFDGVRFETLENIHRSTPPNLWIRSAMEDSNHALWIATADAGIFRMEGSSFTHYSKAEGLASESITCLAPAKGGDVWACTDAGMARIHAGKLTMFSNNAVRAACEASDGTLWVGGDGASLSSWDGSKFVAHHLTKLPSDASIRALQCSDDGLWVGTTAGLVRISKAGEQSWTSKEGLADSRILCLAESREGGLWIGTRNGFSRLRNGEIESYRPQEGLSQSTVYSMFEDVEGSLWVGTKNGLNQFFSARGLPYTVNEGLPSNDTGPILQDRSGTIWIGMLGTGLARFDGKRFEVTTSKQGLASNTIYSLAEDRDGALWAGTTLGINRLRNGRIDASYSTAQGLPSPHIRALFFDHTGTLWAGTEKGPAMFKNGSFTTPKNIPGELNGPIAAINEDRDGRVYLATEKDGLFYYQDGAAHELLQNGASIHDVDALYTDPDGLLWIGTVGGGLRLLDHGQKMTSFFVRDGIFDNEIYGIIRDDQDHLWMACSKGLFSVNRADLLEFDAGKRKKIVSTPYSPTDALRTIECRSGVQPGSARMRDGRVWFSTIRGLYVFDPNHLVLNIPPPPVVIEEVTVNGERVEPAAIGAIAPGLKNLEFTYSGLTFLQPNRITFRYMLEDFDKSWISAGTRREAFYTNLPPGKYRFRVIGCNADGFCNETGASTPFSLAPHFYQRWWFPPLCAALLGLAAWMIYQLRIHRLQEQFNIILTERSRIARELHDTLIQGLSGITMEMQALAGRLRTPEERATLEDIVRDAGTCLRETRRSVAGLRSQQGPGSGLASAIAQAAKHITEAKAIKLKLKLDKGPSEMSPEVQYNLLRIASEAVNNSVKHSGAKTIEVVLESTPEMLQLSVKDDGSGFSRENGNVRPGHYGLIGMKERAAQIGAELNLASEPARGTTISVLLPTRMSPPKQAGPKQTVGVHTHVD
jgi:ligand-binding sensor domain-containing protein/signal transduction histidine kinase